MGRRAGGWVDELRVSAEECGAIPLGWAGSTEKMEYLNYGDALSPVMVALCSSRPVVRIPSRSLTTRLAAVGTIGHAFRGGTTCFWGTGTSSWANPSAPAGERIGFVPPPDSSFRIFATRGPISNRILGGGESKPVPYGDPVWLLPRFYRPEVEKKYELGVILHLSELVDRRLEANPRDTYARYRIPTGLQDSVRLINTVTEISPAGLRTKTDEILSCRRIVSTSLHGMVIAESYGIPCLYFPPHGPKERLCSIVPSADTKVDLRIADLYSGMGVRTLPIYVQDRRRETDWSDLMRAIDGAWSPVPFDGDSFLDAAPFAVDPVPVRSSHDVFDDPLIQNIQYRHNVAELMATDAQRHPGARRPRAKDVVAKEPGTREAGTKEAGSVPASGSAAAPGVEALAVPAVSIPDVVPPFAEVVAAAGGVPLAWAATTRTNPSANLGDALSALVVSVMAGKPIIRRNFDSALDRLVAVGTIGQAQRNGIVRLWGTGFDALRNAFDPTTARFLLPPATRFEVAALRGPRSAATVRAEGVTVPRAYGDPVWFLPRIAPTEAPAKSWDLGVILHITELEMATPGSAPKPGLVRYRIPRELEGNVRIIDTYAENSTDSLLDKVEEIRSCRRIVSTSFHGLVIAEAFGIPCAWFSTRPVGPVRLRLDDPATPIDHRVWDWYSGTRATHLATYGQDRGEATDWRAVMRWVDRACEPVRVDEAPLFDAFPLPPAVSLADRSWVCEASALAELRY